AGPGENATHHTGPRKEEHVVAERARPVGDGQRGARVRHEPPQDDQHGRRGERRERQAMRHRSPDPDQCRRAGERSDRWPILRQEVLLGRWRLHALATLVAERWLLTAGFLVTFKDAEPDEVVDTAYRFASCFPRRRPPTNGSKTLPSAIGERWLSRSGSGERSTRPPSGQDGWAMPG